MAIISSPLALARPGGGWLRELGRRLPGPEPLKTRHARPAAMALRRALPRVPLGHFSAWPPEAEAPLPPGCRGAQSPRIRRRATQAVHHVSQRGATACPNAGAVINARAARGRSWRYANLVFLHRFWSWFRGALCKICDVFQRARRILSPLRLPVPPRPRRCFL